MFLTVREDDLGVWNGVPIALKRRWSLALSLAMLPWVPQSSAERAHGEPAPPRGLSLIARATRSVTSADRVEIEYEVRNAGEARVFNNHPSNFSFEVWDPGGRRLEAVGRGYEPMAFGLRVNLVIPRDGFVGARFNLTCLTSGYAPAVGPSSECALRFPFTRAGEYKVVVRYTGLQVATEGIDRSNAGALISDTVRIQVNR